MSSGARSRRTTRPSPGLLITALLIIGTALALGLLVQTVVNYRYVSDNLIEQEARRVAAETVRAVERIARLSRPQDGRPLSELIDELRSERSDQVARIALRQVPGTLIAESANPGAERTPPGPGRGGPGRPMRRDAIGGREVFAGEFPCRCGAAGESGQGSGRSDTGRPDQRVLIEITLYRDGLSAPFARLRRDALVSASAGLTLLVALALIALRVRPYVRGKQLEAQVTLARAVQRDLLPAAAVRAAGLDVAAECLPASRVGGDFYDIITLPDGRLTVVVGDVSGHGIAASLLMGLIHGAMSAPPWGLQQDEAVRAAGLNRLLLEKSSSERFASLCWCALDPASGAVRYINAGHPPPMWLRRSGDATDAIDRLTEGGPLLGVLADVEYRAAAIDVRPGDVLALFSDGLTEAVNESGEFFGEDRLADVLRAHADAPAKTICNAMLAAVESFAGARAIEDDQTLLILRVPPRFANAAPPAPSTI